LATDKLLWLQRLTGYNVIKYLTISILMKDLTGVHED